MLVEATNPSVVGLYILPLGGVGCVISISNKVHAIAGFNLSALWRLTGFAWQDLQTDGSEHLPSILARNFLEASF